jgi:hypothetical protein
MQMSRRRAWMPLGAAALAVVAITCAASRESPSRRDFAGSPNPHIRLFAYLLKDSVWLQKDRVIYVCWENVDPQPGSDADNVRAAVLDTWDKESALEFRGWGRCTPKSKGIRIRAEDSGPHVKALGRGLNGMPSGMVLNFTFASWSPDCRQMRDYCIRGIAVHEFGHAIGFAHEQNRPNAPGECRLLRQGSDGDVLLTPYDPDSVMNYCNEKYNNDGQLSSLDIGAVRAVYGAP